MRMNERIRSVFESNKKLIDFVDRAIYYFRRQQYEEALKYSADSIEGIDYLIRTVFEEKQYFLQLKEETVSEMLEGLLSAKKKGDYILMADIFELQLVNFIEQVQEQIMNREEYPYSARIYEKNIRYIEAFDPQLAKRLLAVEKPETLLKEAYAIEYTSCGMMTLAALDHDEKIYFHSNNHVMLEAFLLAKEWTKIAHSQYHIYGLGLSYHIQAMLEETHEEEIYIYESDFNIVRLTCSFIDLENILTNKRVHFVFDEQLKQLREVAKQREGAGILVHYPSYRNQRENNQFLEAFIPGIHVLEGCE